MSLSYDKLMEECLLDLQFKEGSGTITRDWAKPHHNDPTLNNTPTWTTEGDLPVIDFDRSANESISIADADAADLEFTNEILTICAWINIDALNTRSTIISKGRRDTNGWGFRIDSDATLVFMMSSSVQESKSDADIVIDTWYFVAVSINTTSTLNLYINGVDKTNTINTGSILAGNYPLYVASLWNGTTDNFDGTIWRPRIWDRALTKEEIQFIYNRERWLFDV